ncbi:MAG: hypothetical protein ABEI86_13740 [Halobacteriaceae archaeon]
MGHEPRDSLSRERIREDFPWVDTEGKEMIIGSDIDAIMSAAFLSEYLDWEPIGFYTDFENLYTKPGVSTDDVVNAVWVDLDIYHPDIPSIGHHILNFRLNDEIPGHDNSLNPNLLRGMYHGNFQRKYPLGTIHFLTWLYEVPETTTETQQLLYWVPDSTWINGQSHRFRENVRDWLFNCIPTDFLTESFDWTDEAEFEEALERQIYPRIEDSGFSRGRGQVTSRHRNLGGYQCTFVNPNKLRNELQSLVELIAEIMNWEPFTIPQEMTVTSGERTSNYSYSKVLEDYDGIDEFLTTNDIFSYAIPNRNTLNYTTGIDLESI